MGLELYVEKLPDDLKEAFKADITKYIPAPLSREEAKGLLKGNEFLSAEFQSNLSLKHEEALKKFPSMVEEEIKKRGTKQPWEIDLQAQGEELAKLKRELVLKDRKTVAITELTKAGMDASLSDYFLIEDEEQFTSKLSGFVKLQTGWRDSEVKKVKEGKFGQKEPQGGSGQILDLKAQHAKALADGDVDKAMVLKRQMATQ